MPRPISAAILFYIFTSILCTAQELPLTNPSGQAVLPAPSEGVNAGLIINYANAPEFKNLIVPEIYPLMRSKLFVMDSVSGLKVDLSTVLKLRTNVTKTDQDVLQANGFFKEGYRANEGIPFPDWDKEPNGKIKAFKFAWNVQAVHWNYKIFSSDFSISYIEEAKLSKQLKGNWTRIYPQIISSEDKSIQVFRELFNFTNPTILSTLKYLTFRFFGLEEDMLWFSSPSLKTVRELTGSNRADSILDSAFSLDDLLGWSGKPELSDINLDQEITALVPFSSYDSKTMGTDSNKCDVFVKPAPNGFSGTGKWNYLSHRFPDSFAWLPTDAVFVPRKIIRLELVPKDPFSLYGRQILYVDKELMLPYYKFIFNRSGYLWKTVYNFPVVYLSKDKNRSYVFSDYLITEDRQSKNANVIEFDNLSFCNAYNDKIKISNFDPLKLLPPQVQPTPVKISSKSN